MSLITTKSQKNFYTPAQDLTIVTMRNEGKTSKEIAAVVGHSEASVIYRITRKLAKVDNFADIKYRGQAAAAPAAEAPEAAAEETEA